MEKARLLILQKRLVGTDGGASSNQGVQLAEATASGLNGGPVLGSKGHLEATGKEPAGMEAADGEGAREGLAEGYDGRLGISLPPASNLRRGQGAPSQGSGPGSPEAGQKGRFPQDGGIQLPIKTARGRRGTGVEDVEAGRLQTEEEGVVVRGRGDVASNPRAGFKEGRKINPVPPGRSRAPPVERELDGGRMEDTVGITVQVSTDNALQFRGKLVVGHKIKVLRVLPKEDTIEVPHQDRGNRGSEARPKAVEDGGTITELTPTGREVEVEEGKRANGSRLDESRLDHLHLSSWDSREDSHSPARLLGGRKPDLVSRGQGKGREG
jgi:hypothetical protein